MIASVDKAVEFNATEVKVKPSQSARKPCWINAACFIKIIGNFSYSQVHKYWDIDAILIFLALYTTTMDLKWNKQDSIQFNFICIARLTKELCHKAALQRTGPQWQQWQGKTPWQITERNLEQNLTQRGTICRWLAPVLMCFNNCNLRVFTSKSGERCRNNSFYMCLPLFKGPKVMGQLAAQLFHGQVRYSLIISFTRSR